MRMRHPVIHRAVFWVAFAFAALLPFSAAQAGDEKLQAIFSQRGVWDTNPMMQTKNAKSVYGSETTPEIVYINETPDTHLSGRASVTQNFFDRSEYNSTDFHAATELGKRNQRWDAKFLASLAYDTTRTSELTTFGENIRSSRHFTYALKPEAMRVLSPIARLTLSSFFEKHVYESRDYSNYTIFGLSPSYLRSLTPLTSAVVQMQVQRYQSERFPRRRVDSVGPSAGLITRLTPEITFRATGGMQASREQGRLVVEKDWKWKPIYAVDATYSDENNTAKLNATRARQAFSNGSEYLTTTLGLENSHKLSDLFTLRGSVDYRFADYNEDFGQNLDSMISGQAGLSYRLTRKLDATADYTYQWKDLTNGGGQATQNLVKLGFLLRYDFDDLTP